MSIYSQDRFDNFLFGMALANHATYLSVNWAPETKSSIKIASYIAGMGEHLLYLAFKVVTAVSFIFINIFLLMHYLISCMQRCEESQLAYRKIRLEVGMLIFIETFPGMCIDAVGILCPPLAYRAHEFLMENVTQRYFEICGVVDLGMNKTDFKNLDFFGKVFA